MHKYGASIVIRGSEAVSVGSEGVKVSAQVCDLRLCFSKYFVAVSATPVRPT